MPWCTCKGVCKPVCDKVGTPDEGWYEGCGQRRLIALANCSQGTCQAKCDPLGAYRGRCSGDNCWVSSCDNSPIDPNSLCTLEWDCIEHPENQCVLPCTENCNCPSDRPVCVQGNCAARASTSCAGHADCACGEICTNGGCTPAAVHCRRSCDCPASGANPFVCVNGACVEKMDTGCLAMPCPCGEVCTTAGTDSTCAPGCGDNCGCPSSTPICVMKQDNQPGRCTQPGVFECDPLGQGCPCGFICRDNGCIEVFETCIDNCDCRDALNPICHNGVCAKPMIEGDCPCGLACGL